MGMGLGVKPTQWRKKHVFLWYAKIKNHLEVVCFFLMLKNVSNAF